MYSYDYRAQNEIINDLQKAINGEFNAIQCYEHLARLAPNAQIKKQIEEIRRDEKKHYKAFSRAYVALTNATVQPQSNEACPNNYRDGIIYAFKDEQDTVDFYLDAADRATDPYIKEIFIRAAADEQNHAVWFLYFMR